MPRPMMRRPVVDPDVPEVPDALRLLPERDEPDALRALLLPLVLPRPLELLLEPRAPLLELPFPPPALIPPLLRFGMFTSG